MMRGWDWRAEGGHLLQALLVALSTLSTPLGAFGATLPPPSGGGSHAPMTAATVTATAAPRARTTAAPAAQARIAPASPILSARDRLSSLGTPPPGTRWFFAAQRLPAAGGQDPPVRVRQELAILNPNAVAVPVVLTLYARGATQPRVLRLVPFA